MNEITGGPSGFAERTSEPNPEELEATRRRKLQRTEETFPKQNDVGEALRKRFVIAGDRYYYRDRDETIAFEDRGTRLITEWQDPNVIHGMILRAREKGWASLQIKGSEAFKAEAWVQAKVAGFEVTGYEPRELDHAKLADRLKDVRRPSTTDREDRPQENVITEQAARTRRERLLNEKQQVALHTLEAILKERGDAPAMRAAVLAEATDRLRGDRIIVGRVREHGIAHFEHNQHNEKSYYVQLETAQGVKDVWGTDLARALENSDLKIRDRVALVQKRKEPVVVHVAVRDQQGRTTETSPRTVSRNVWEVVNLDRMGERERHATLRRAGTSDKDPVVPVCDQAAPRREHNPVLTATNRRERERADR
jgi:Large polyvalent protein-associated domain 7